MGLNSSADNAKLDCAGIILSALCVIHCLALPLLLAALPLAAISQLPDWLRDAEWVHAALLIPVVLVSGPVLARGAGYDYRLGALAVAAFAALISALFVEQHRPEQLLTLTGAALLLVAHWLNLRSKSAL